MATEIYLGNIKGPKGDPGEPFIPAVDADGNLTWTNAGGLPNPPAVNIKGEKGDIPQVSFRYDEATGLLYYEIGNYIDGHAVEW